MRKPQLGEVRGEDEHEAFVEDELDKITKWHNRMKKEKVILAILGVIIGAVSVFLALIWFDWKLLVVIFLAMFGNNLSQRWTR